ncbi:IQ and ubiquitin-like domain-containing protein [Sitodiplosis mosellana]|uniref:IQ and ubiquitin-like domain-containing protein n=1 Tax=Sitodiplosis mosellana TaxID=263140 RepID=UPI002444BC3E|nr:IQ and ubiquitin-like domain-containing protein [Sitodiplosis mosellana]
MYSLSLIKQSNQVNKNSSPSVAASTDRIFDKNITVRFELNEFDTVAQVYPELTTIGEVLEDVASKFQLLPKYLSIKQKFGMKIPKTARLYQLCSNDFGILDFKLGLSDLANHINESIRIEHEKIRLDTNSYYRLLSHCTCMCVVCRQNLLPDFVSVAIPDKDDPLNSKRIIVEIINIPIIKPFLGGYVNKLTGAVYHNAYTQTGPLKQQAIKYSDLVTRDTQTTGELLCTYGASSSGELHKDQQVEQKTDKSAEMECRMAIVIQRAVRLFLWKRFIHNLSVERRSRKSDTNNETSTLKDQCSDEISSADNKVIPVIGSPQTRHDFQLLESKIHKWKESQIEYIKERFNDKAKQQVEFTKVLEHEIKLLNEIEKKRNKMRKEAYDKHMDQLLDKMGAPVKWIGYKNIKCEMDLLQCQKIRKLTTLYRQLKTSGTNRIDRIEFVNELYRILVEEPHSTLLDEVNKRRKKPHNSFGMNKFRITFEMLIDNNCVLQLLDLLKREQKMLLALVDKKTIDSLRRRQNLLFRNFIVSQKVYEPSVTSTPSP